MTIEAALVAMALLGQAADGGVRLRADAGVEAPRHAAPTTLEVDKLRREVLELKQRLGEAEGKVARLEAGQGKVDALSTRLEALTKQLAALERKQDEGEARRDAAEQRVVQKRAQAEQATLGLNAALQALSLGNTNVDAALRAAEAAYDGAALQALRAARQALASGDLNAARQAIALAILEQQAAR